MLKKLLAAEVLPVRFLEPVRHHIPVAQII
jgi:hypothetical protein